MSSIAYEKTLKAVGDKVVIRKIDKPGHETIFDGIVIPHKSTVNGELCKGKVESVGSKVKDLKVGDIVLFDYLATYKETYPICVIKEENIICFIEEGDASEIDV